MPRCRHEYARTSRGRRCMLCGKPSRAGAKAVVVAVVVLALLVWFAAYVGTGIDAVDRAGGKAVETVLDVTGRIPVPDNLQSVTDEAEKVASEVESAAETTARAVLDVASDMTETVPVRLESGFDRRLVERHIYEMTNQERRLAGVEGLIRDETIDVIAYEHSADMAARGYFSHDTPEGLDPTGRAERAGYECRKDYGSYYTTGLAENVSQSYTYSSYMTAGVTSSYTWLESEAELARQTVRGWMDSPGHRENILNPQYDRIGIGVEISSDEQVLATQNFC